MHSAHSTISMQQLQLSLLRRVITAHLCAPHCQHTTTADPTAPAACPPQGPEGTIKIQYNSYEEGSKVGKPATLEVDCVIGADGANSRVAKDIDAGEYDYAIAFQVGSRA